VQNGGTEGAPRGDGPSLKILPTVFSVRGQSGNKVVSKRSKTPRRPNAASMVGLPPSSYRITAQDGHLASCDGNKQALAPVGVPPRRFSAVSYLGALCFNSVVSSDRRPENTLKVPSGSHARGGVVLHVRQSDGNTRAHSDRLHSCGGHGHVWVGCEASHAFLRRFSGVFTGFLTQFPRF
jgi:hypothetical protein